MKKSVVIIVVLIFLIGMGVFLYPYIYSYFFNERSSEAIANFIENFPPPETKKETTEQFSDSGVHDEDTITVYPELYEAFAEYNEMLADGGQSFLNTESVKSFPVSLEDYGIEGNMVGYISMSAIKLELPLYLGANDKNLQDGAAVMGYTSAPIGGISTNCVIAGHNNWNGAGRFKYIENLKIGDEVVITTFWGERKYTVSNMAIIDDNDYASIHIQKGKDMITLMTCHYTNSVKMRYIVYCEFLGENDLK